MEDEKTVIGDVSSETYDAADKPFDFIEEGQETALLCEPDSSLRSRTADCLKDIGYLVSNAASAQDALKKMRYHTYDVIVVNEHFDCADPDANLVLAYLQELDMQVRRRMFVTLVGSRFRTMDNMSAFNRSVNITVNLENLDDIGTVVKRGVAENKAFYHVFRETLADVAGQS